MTDRLVCNRDPSHTRFSVTAHVAETWVVDPAGNYLKRLNNGVEVTHEPRVGNPDFVFTCFECGSTTRTI